MMSQHHPNNNIGGGLYCSSSIPACGCPLVAVIAFSQTSISSCSSKFGEHIATGRNVPAIGLESIAKQRAHMLDVLLSRPR